MLSPRELEAVRNPRIQVKNAHNCFNAIRNEMSWESRVLDESTIQKIVEAYERHKPETYSPHYNTANFFIAEHVAAKVGEKVRLTRKEVVHVKNLFGRLYYDPPERFKASSKKSAEKLYCLGGKFLKRQKKRLKS